MPRLLNETQSISCADPLVQTKEGPLRGRTLTSVRGGQYHSFQGIPYALPPVGSLRFKPPQSVNPWVFERSAKTEGPCCFNVDWNQVIANRAPPKMSEDCLYLNVYTPQLDDVRKKAVMFWVHGGAFVMGSGNTDIYGPDYLITEDVVLVTINYRLGPFGFLNLQNSDCPGNNGLKDMVAALQWVQRNIASFGGDPRNVTIFGLSAGGASVHYLMLSKLSRGLFHKVIAQSGLAVNPWALNTKPRETAFKLGELLGCKTTDEKELFEFLLHVPAEDLVGKDVAVKEQIDPYDYYLRMAFTPTIEPEGEGAFLTQTPMELLRSGDIPDIPFMTGFATLEGLVVEFFHGGIPVLETLEEIQRLTPLDWVFERNAEKLNQIGQKIKDYYFHDGYDERRCIEAFSAVLFTNGFVTLVDTLAEHSIRKSPIYFYQFSFAGNLSLFKKHNSPLVLSYHKKGTNHGDDLPYLFHPNIAPDNQLKRGSREYKAVADMTRLWSNFAKHGDPTPEDHLWTPLTPQNRVYLDIDDELTLQKDSALFYDAQFWSDLHKIAVSS